MLFVELFCYVSKKLRYCWMSCATGFSYSPPFFIWLCNFALTYSSKSLALDGGAAGTVCTSPYRSSRCTVRLWSKERLRRLVSLLFDCAEKLLLVMLAATACWVTSSRLLSSCSVDLCPIGLPPAPLLFVPCRFLTAEEFVGWLLRVGGACAEAAS